MKSPQDRCSECGKTAEGYDIVRCGSLETGYRELCWRCYNTEFAKLDGLDFQHMDFEPVDIIDFAGKSHQFHFRTRLLGPTVAIDACELRNELGGYSFQVIGDSDGDLLMLLARLIDRMRRSLSIQHVERGPHGLQIADHQTVRGRIEWDEAREGRVPMLIIDGRKITWEQLGRMLMTFDGWQVKLEIRDRSEDLL